MCGWGLKIEIKTPQFGLLTRQKLWLQTKLEIDVNFIARFNELHGKKIKNE
jgi:hypothetical protein